MARRRISKQKGIIRTDEQLEQVSTVTDNDRERAAAWLERYLPNPFKPLPDATIYEGDKTDDPPKDDL
jgi:hypothetical protein